jgi:hypothetical protein
MLAGVAGEEDREVDCEEVDESRPWQEGEYEGDEEVVGTEVVI